MQNQIQLHRFNFIDLLFNSLNFLAFKDKHCRKQKFIKHVGDTSRKCQSIKRVSIAVCAGFCVPQYFLQLLNSQFNRQKSKMNKFVCTAEHTKTKNVIIYCPDDKSYTRYKIKIIKTCKCELRINDTKKRNSNTNPA